jgi:hypothetical protein
MLGGVQWVSLPHGRMSSCPAYQTTSERLFRIQFLRDLRSFFGTTFKIVPADSTESLVPQLLYSCYGTGYVNANRTLA